MKCQGLLFVVFWGDAVCGFFPWCKRCSPPPVPAGACLLYVCIIIKSENFLTRKYISYWFLPRAAVSYWLSDGCMVQDVYPLQPLLCWWMLNFKRSSCMQHSPIWYIRLEFQVGSCHFMYIGTRHFHCQHTSVYSHIRRGQRWNSQLIHHVQGICRAHFLSRVTSYIFAVFCGRFFLLVRIYSIICLTVCLYVLL